MPETQIESLTTTQMKTGVPQYSVAADKLDEADSWRYWENPDWPVYLGYLKKIPEYRNAVRSLAIWTCGRGWTADERTTRLLNLIRGWGEDSIDSIFQDMIVVKKTNGDAYAEIITNNGKPIHEGGILINLKKLNPSKTRIRINDKGMIDGYEVQQKNGEWKKIRKEMIFHISNDRIANEIHGTSVLESTKWIIDWKNEMLEDLRRVMHRSTIRVMYIDMDNTSKLSTVRTQYKEAIKNGELLVLPGKKGADVEFEDLTLPPTQAWLEVIRYTDNYFYEILGVPKIITGGTQNYTEASSKIGYLTFEQPYMTEQRLLEQDILNQLGLEIKFDRPVSLKEEMQSDEAANTGQVGFQSSEIQPGKNE